MKNIAEAFCAQDKSNCDFYQANARAYDAKLADLENKIIKTVATIPQEKRIVVVGHNAFKYFEQAYGIHFLSPQGISTESEASAADVAGILKKIKENNASAIFLKIFPIHVWLNKLPEKLALTWLACFIQMPCQNQRTGFYLPRNDGT